ncbi:alpha/beta hydrolase [Nonomuraea longispora]|uniref:alpha/beta hydrolase n=1 Tax=Nonomuraea longispora TaxID=1848320 RepID=UPI001C704BE6|nr:alpha/beta hydrolase [Nonomuraea longispora]
MRTRLSRSIVASSSASSAWTLARTLRGSLLTVEGEQHGALMAGNACVSRTVAAYLVALKSPSEGARCKL